MNNLDGISESKNKKENSPFLWKGNFDEIDLNIQIHFTDKYNFYGKLLRESASISHLNYSSNNPNHLETSLLSASYQKANSEEEIYQKVGSNFIPAFQRNGLE